MTPSGPLHLPEGMPNACMVSALLPCVPIGLLRVPPTAHSFAQWPTHREEKRHRNDGPDLFTWPELHSAHLDDVCALNEAVLECLEALLTHIKCLHSEFDGVQVSVLWMEAAAVTLSSVETLRTSRLRVAPGVSDQITSTACCGTPFTPEPPIVGCHSPPNRLLWDATHP